MRVPPGKLYAIDKGGGGGIRGAFYLMFDIWSKVAGGDSPALKS